MVIFNDANLQKIIGVTKYSKKNLNLIGVAIGMPLG